MDASGVRTILGICGNVISFLLFASPIPTFIKIIKEKSVQQYKPDPYLATVLNCAVWVIYGLPWVHPDSILVITINGTGLAMELIYVCIFLIFSAWSLRKKMIIVLLIELVFFAAMVLITFLVLHGTDRRSIFVGIVCVIFTILMYATPLTVMKRVITTKSVKYMPFYLSLFNLLNGIVWSAYALIEFDLYVLVPNGLGALSGLVQLILYAVFYKSTNWNVEEDSRPPPEVQLSRENQV